MPRFANERDLTPLMTPSAVPAAGQESARGIMKLVAAYSQPERRGGSVVDLLDGIGGLGWSAAGFVVGAVFWHFIGFWGFVAEVVLAGGPATGVDKAARGQPQPELVRMADANTIASADEAAACTSLVLDRRTGLTSADDCGADHHSLPMDDMEGREDRLSGHSR